MAEVLNRTGEDAERVSSPQERARQMASDYAKTKEKRTLLEGAGSTVIPGFRYVGLIRGEYSDEQIVALEAEVSRREARSAMLPPKPKPAPFETPRPTTTESHEKGKKKEVSRNGVKKVIAIGLAGAAVAGLAGGVGYQLGHNNDGKGLPLSYELHQNQNEDSEAMEQAESIDVSDQYAGHFANDEGNGYNENKSSRYAFGESLEDADYEEIMQELEHMALHEPSLFAAQYFDLDDNAKLQFELEDGTVIDTSTMTMQQLTELMATNDEAHEIMARHYLSLVSQGYEFTTLNDRYANVYGKSSATRGEQFTSSNIVAVHCFTDEHGSRAITFKYEIPGKDGEYATTTLRLGCGLQVVRPEKEAERIITTTDEVKPDDPEPEEDEPGGGDDEQGKKPLTEEQVFENEDSPQTTEWDPSTTGPGSVSEKPTSSSSTENMGGKGNTGAKPESSSSQKPATQQQQKASQETGSQKNPTTTQSENKKAETQSQATTKQETHQESVRQQSDTVVQDHTDSSGNVDLDALLDMD
ncbi:hypothetical protein J5500_04815 [Candidatus Saccharibacteria bacterium]|nr:hypothetical protein [Candidatus Saccharibacteria bacterium]